MKPEDRFSNEADPFEISSMRDQLLQLLQRRDGLSFLEITRMIPEARGTSELCVPNDVIIWEGLSPALVKAIVQMLREGSVVLRHIDPLAYLAERGGLPYPIPEGPNDFWGTRWIPTVICRPAAKSLFEKWF